MTRQAESGGIRKGGRAKLLGKAAIVAGVLVGLVLLCGAAHAQGKMVKLKWVFDEDPRSLLPETKKHLQVIKFLAVKEIKKITTLTGKYFFLTVKLKTEIDCVEARQGEVYFFLEMPKDYVVSSKHEGYYHLYDTSSANSIQNNREYFGLLDCSMPDQLSYIEESYYILK